MRKHEKFILTPIESILEESCFSMSLLDDGLEIYSLSDYMMQSLFLKMTGFQEQKVKCILWELATDDYELRYLRYKKEQIGEASSYDDKVKVFRDLIMVVTGMSGDNNALLSDKERDNIITDTLQAMKKLSEQRFMKGWSRRMYIEFEQLMKNCGKECLFMRNGKKYDFFSSCEKCGKRKKSTDQQICNYGNLKEVYGFIYKHRNRCAHNTVSYQQNLPCLEHLQDKNYVFENYFVRFAFLIMIDKMFVSLFKKYLQLAPGKFLL